MVLFPNIFYFLISFLEYKEKTSHRKNTYK